jgi:hypothetical protein
MRFLMAAVDEEFGVEALADEAPLHVREGGYDCIDRTGLRFLGQLRKRQQSRHRETFVLGKQVAAIPPG